MRRNDFLKWVNDHYGKNGFEKTNWLWDCFHGKEIWRSVVGYEGLYEVSTLGKIVSLNEKRNGIGRKRLKGSPNWKGYLIVRLYKGLVPKDFPIHRVVALTFLPNPKSKPQVNHLKPNKKNNKLLNLEWATNGENQKHAYANGLNWARKGALHKSSRIVGKFMEGKLIKRYMSIADAVKDGYDQSRISTAVRRKNPYKGYDWIFLDNKKDQKKPRIKHTTCQ